MHGAILDQVADGAATAPTVRLLGPISMSGVGGRVPVGGPRAQRLIAALALRVNRPVAVSFMVDAVWGTRPPRTSRDQVHNGVARLRQVLAAQGSDVRLSRVADGYQLDIDPDRIDVHAFERDLGRARVLSARADLDGAAETIRAGLGHWFGDALGGIAEGALAGEAARLEELRLAAYDDLFVHELARDNAARVVGEIAVLANRHPLRERLVLHLMTALRRTGRSAEALRIFRDHRERVVAELGVEPDHALRILQLDIVQDGAGHARPTSPSQTRTVADDIELASLLTDLASLAMEVSRRVGRP